MMNGFSYWLCVVFLAAKHGWDYFTPNVFL